MSLDRETFQEIKKLPIHKGKVVTNSMSPIIKVGEEIVIDVGAKDLKRFDIIVIYQNEKLICHYLWQMNKIVKPILYQTRNIWGQTDFPIEDKDYLGKVVSHHMSFFWKLKIFLKDLSK